MCSVQDPLGALHPFFPRALLAGTYGMMGDVEHFFRQETGEDGVKNLCPRRWQIARGRARTLLCVVCLFRIPREEVGGGENSKALSLFQRPL